MVERVSVARAKARFSALVTRVAYGGARIILERRGRPLAALVSLGEVEHLAQWQDVSFQPRGALALVGAWKSVEDRELDALVAEIYARRAEDTARPVALPG